MPELPEVESVRRSLIPLLLHRRVVAAVVLRRDVVIAPGDPAGGFSRQRSRAKSPRGGALKPAPLAPAHLLVGRRVVALVRRGKQLAIIADSGAAMVIQLGMSGTVERIPDSEPIDRHTHVLWTLDSGVRIRFRDPRRFGAVRVFRTGALLAAHFNTLGPDALTIRAVALHAALRGTSRPIKAALLDQQVLAGVGNIYADEALHRAGINPRFRASRLSPALAGKLAASIRAVLRAAIQAGGSTLRDYADADGRAGSYQSRHAVYGRAGLACRRCRRVLSTGSVGQRTTVWCAACQPARVPAATDAARSPR